ncbi:MAG: hypothetical protein VYE68_10465 [Acidobacteriota bacterium]|nr:hypothetical protein [Acidobacteriota bacterium]
MGIRAHYSPRYHPETGELLQSYWQNGNVEEQRETVSIRARRAVILASGGHAGKPEVRSMFYPALREPAFPTSDYALQGPHGQDASALTAGLRIGVNLAGMQQNVSYPTTFHISTRLGTRDAYTTMMPGYPTFDFRGSAGVNVGNVGFEEFIAVNHYSALRPSPTGPNPPQRSRSGGVGVRLSINANAQAALNSRRRAAVSGCRVKFSPAMGDLLGERPVAMMRTCDAASSGMISGVWSSKRILFVPSS